MGCENVTFNEPTNKRSQSLEIHAKTTLRINQERNVCMFTPYANYEEVNDGALLLEQDERSCFAYRESKFPSCSSLDGHVPLVESRKPSERASSLDHVEFVLPHDDGYIHAAPERPNMRKPFWKNLWFWQPNKKSGSC
ncbi:uncharacterized protein [Physcomitrium patens]|uniref:Uncharacterized protein n=1 Tax=Physcomitrium patens TaxID=3218 RepID=A0A2K1IEV2_PHYPA|nr:uncharacterized protein LOC112277215 [Physcomitrium patens]XP_024365062.1 uncharacterized protein LOC112277215 [Physcomitrium patens]PNR27806.1 hypothetical protein PHYPA_029958 [Physcomitrium patens]|eukprot:XP_024365061.1 uncharacterized protein LOC112277215 [Physcomitrella patens]